MKKNAKPILLLVLAVLAAGAWLAHFHAALVAPVVPGRLLKLIAQAPQTSDDADATDDQANEVPVKTMAVTSFTFHRYVDGFGTIAPRPPGPDSGSAAIASPTAGVVAQVLCRIGQRVSRGEVLIQLDDRLAAAQEDQAVAALAQARASLASLLATPRPPQLAVAELAVEKSRAALDFAQENYDRQKKLAADQGVSAKAVEQAALDLASAKNDLASNENQIALLSPTREDLAQEQAKVAQAQAALAVAHVQRQLFRIVAPLDGTVTDLTVNPGESVDTTRTLAQIVNLDHLTVDLDVPAEQLASLKIGQKALVIPGGSMPQCQGTVAMISPLVDPKTGAVRLGIDLDAGAAAMPGLTVHVRIIAEEHEGLSVPRASVVTDDDGNRIIDVLDGDIAHHKPVTVGLQEDDHVEIRADGLKDGDTIVTDGAYGLPDNTKVSPAHD